jgi:hypothetical protein
LIRLPVNAGKRVRGFRVPLRILRKDISWLQANRLLGSCGQKRFSPKFIHRKFFYRRSEL